MLPLQAQHHVLCPITAPSCATNVTPPHQCLWVSSVAYDTAAACLLREKVVLACENQFSDHVTPRTALHLVLLACAICPPPALVPLSSSVIRRRCCDQSANCHKPLLYYCCTTAAGFGCFPCAAICKSSHPPGAQLHRLLTLSARIGNTTCATFYALNAILRT